MMKKSRFLDNFTLSVILVIDFFLDDSTTVLRTEVNSLKGRVITDLRYNQSNINAISQESRIGKNTEYSAYGPQ